MLIIEDFCLSTRKIKYFQSYLKLSINIHHTHSKNTVFATSPPDLCEEKNIFCNSRIVEWVFARFLVIRREHEFQVPKVPGKSDISPRWEETKERDDRHPEKFSYVTYFTCTFFKHRNWGSEMLKILCKDTGLKSSSSWIWNYVYLIPKPKFSI